LFDGVSLTLTYSCVAPIGQNVAWNPDGKTIAFYGLVDKNFYIYDWDGVVLTLLDSVTYGVGNAHKIVWSPDGRYVVLTQSDKISLYEWNGFSLTLLFTENIAGGCIGASWSPDSRFLALAIYGLDKIVIYEFNGIELTVVANVFSVYQARAVSWKHDGNYLIFSGSLTDFGNAAIKIAQVNYDALTYAPSYNNGFITGDSINGSESDLDLFLLSGAVLDIQGTVMYDNV
jgi:Tol biopolymer transport system component